jgi:hypothetical protein
MPAFSDSISSGVVVTRLEPFQSVPQNPLWLTTAVSGWVVDVLFTHQCSTRLAVLSRNLSSCTVMHLQPAMLSGTYTAHKRQLLPGG